MRRLATNPAARNFEDDCAVLTVGSETLILTHDMMAQDIHFRANADMADVAWKLVATNLSDLASKGAEPLGVLLGFALGEDDARFAQGLGEVLTTYRVPLLGGDTIRAKGPRTFGLTAIGRATHTPVPDRRNAKPGENVWVTGELGRAMLGFEHTAHPETGSSYNQAFHRPCPRIDEGKALAPYVSAMMDVSDGLLLDSWRMANASKATIQLDIQAIPVADPARRDECIRWGDDYELLFTLPPDEKPSVPATRIGCILEKRDAPLLMDHEAVSDPSNLGFRH